jgi:hypothetical protein
MQCRNYLKNKNRALNRKEIESEIKKLKNTGKK